MIQRKPPKRLFTGMAGSPLAQVAECVALEPAAVPEPMPVAAPKKRGRPAKNGTPMTAAERKAASRANKAAKVEDAERRKLIAKFVRLFKRMLPARKPGELEERVAERRKWVRDEYDKYMTLPISALRLYDEHLKATPDWNGRLPGETSGESDRKYGMSGLEQRLAAITGQHERPERPHDSDEGDLRPPRGNQLSPEYIAHLEECEAVVTDLIKTFYCREPYERRGIFPDGTVKVTRFEAGQCRLCGEHIPDPSDARQHFWREFERGDKARSRWEEIQEREEPEQPTVAELAPFLLTDLQRQWESNKHYQAAQRGYRERIEKRRQETIRAKRGIS